MQTINQEPVTLLFGIVASLILCCPQVAFTGEAAPRSPPEPPLRHAEVWGPSQNLAVSHLKFIITIPF